MRSSIIRSVVLGAVLVAVLFVPVPRAQALTTLAVQFTGEMTVGNGLDYPCAETLSGGIGTLPCPPLEVGSSCLDPLNGAVTALIPNCHLNALHNLQAVNLSATICLSNGMNVNKPGLPAAAGPRCAFVLGGLIGGHCGRSGGIAGGTFTAGGHPYNLDIHFMDLAGHMFWFGHYTNPTNGHHGLVTGFMMIVPPTPVATPGQSCNAKTARNFTIDGTLSFIPEPFL